MRNTGNKPEGSKELQDEDQIKNNDLPYDPNINSDDRQALQERGHSMNPTDDQYLEQRKKPVDFAADDLDIPGRNQADTTHRGKDIPDEENFQYDKSGVKKNRSRQDEIPDEDDREI